MEPLMRIEDLRVCYEDSELAPLQALRGVSLDVLPGECLAIVGESGSGKSTLARACMGLLEKNARITGGSIRFEGHDLAALRGEREWEKLRLRGRKLAMVLQDPSNALNPVMTVGSQIAESFRYSRGMSTRAAKPIVLEMLRDAGFDDPERVYRQYPRQLSGGMNQRVAIAMAVACAPRIMFCDECTSALDVTTQAAVLSYMQRLQRRHDIAMVIVTHDMGVVARMADRVAVMYAGQIVEVGTCREIFYDPRHPYTWTLLSALPQLARARGEFVAMKSAAPDLRKPIVGDAFAPRNPFTVLEIDRRLEPPLFQVSPTHSARTWLLDERAPKVALPACIRAIADMRVAWEEGADSSGI